MHKMAFGALLVLASVALSLETEEVVDREWTPVIDRSQDLNVQGGVRETLIYINAQGKTVLRTPYSRGGYFSEGMAWVGSYPGQGYIDSTGRLIVSGAGFEECGDFSEGIAVVRTGGAQYRYIDRQGKWAIPRTFELNNERFLSRHGFREGRAAVLVDGRWGFIDRTGRTLAEFDEARWFNEGMAAVRMGEKWGFVDASCKIKIPPRFDAVSHWVEGDPLAACFSHGRAAVRLGKMWGYIDETGAFSIQPVFDEALDFHEGLAAVKLNGRWKYINRSGQVVLDAKGALFAGSFYDGLAYIGFNQCWIDEIAAIRSGYLDKTGKLALPVQYISGNFRNKLARATLEGDINALIDRTGKQVFTIQRVDNPADPMAKIRNSADVPWLKQIVLDPARAAEVTKQPLARGGITGVRASAYCRLGELATEKALSTIREIETRVASVVPAPPKAWFGLSPAPSFHYANQEISPLATARGGDSRTYALVLSGELGDVDTFLSYSSTPSDRSSWTRPKLIPNRIFSGVRNPRLLVEKSGQLLFSFLQTRPGGRSLMEGTDTPWPTAPQLGPQQWRLSSPEIERDSDHDGWTDIEEARLGLDPHKPDSDGDGIPDGSDVCPNYAATAADLEDEQVQMLQRAVFATFGLSGSRHLLLVDPKSRSVQLWGYGGPVICGQTREGWNSRHQYGAFFVSWEVACIRGDKARVEIRDYQGPEAGGLQYIILKKIRNRWFAVKWIEGPVS